MNYYNKIINKKSVKNYAPCTNLIGHISRSLFIYGIAFLAALNFAHAQSELDIFSISGSFTNEQDYETNIAEKAKETGSSMNLNLPVPVSDKTILFTSINYLYFQIDRTPGTSSQIGSFSNLHGIILRQGIIRKIDDKQRLHIFLTPRLMTDMRGFGIENWQFGGHVLHDKTINDNLSIGYGILYNGEFFGPFLLPVVNLNAQIGNKLTIKGLLPVNLNVKYQVSDRFAVGFNHFGIATSFRLNDNNDTGDYVERQSVNLSAFSEYELFSNVYADVKIGKMFNFSYKQFASDQKVDLAIPLATFGDNRIPKNIPFEGGLFLELKLIYRIKIDS